MKKLLLFIVSIAALSINLIGCEHDSRLNNEKKILNLPKRKFIILESADAPLPPEAKTVKSMPSTLVPQRIPNANWKDPIVITKMPWKKHK